MNGQTEEVRWHFDVYDDENPDEGGYHEAKIGTHYLFVSREEDGDEWRLVVADEACEEVASKNLTETVTLPTAKREALLLYAGLVAGWLHTAVNALQQVEHPEVTSGQVIAQEGGDQRDIRKLYTRIEGVRGEWRTYLQVDHQGFCVAVSEDEEWAEWFADMLAVALERLLSVHQPNADGVS